MSEPTPSPDPATAELASRLVDGDLDEHERAAIAEQAEIAEHAATFRRLAQLVADVAPLDPGVVDAMIASAVAGHQQPPVLVVPKLEDRRAHRQRRALVWVGVAAAVALVVVGIGLMNDGAGPADVAAPAVSSVPKDAELATTAGAEEAAADGSTPDAERPAATEAPAGGAASATDFVVVDDAVALAVLARDSEPLTGEVPCASTVPFIPVAYASFRGTNVIVMRNESGRLAYAFDLATCKQLLFSPIS